MLDFVLIQKICTLSVIQKLIASFTHALLLFHIQGIKEESSNLLLGFCSCYFLVTAPSVDQGVLHIYTENTKNRRLMQ